MSSPDNNPNLHYSKIPKAFHSYTTGKPISECIDCGQYLLMPGTPYIIEKAIKKYEGYQVYDVIFEYAICLECAEKMKKQMSTDSMERMEEYFDKHFDLAERGSKLLAEGKTNAEDWIKNCIVDKTPVDELSEYQICALCDGDSIVLSHMPYLISGKIVDAVTSLLSTQTLGELDDFIDKNFGLPPEFKESIKSKKLIFI